MAIKLQWLGHVGFIIELGGKRIYYAEDTDLYKFYPVGLQKSSQHNLLANKAFT
jgi:L-ascorbate metabolism protein UlaG (beta-lactamase superfamily)